MDTDCGVRIQSDENNKNPADILKEGDKKTQDEEPPDQTEKCLQWLENCDVLSAYSESEFSECSESTSNSAMDSGLVFQNNDVAIADQFISNRDSDCTPIIIDRGQSKYDNIKIYKSKKVHVGDVTYINGPVIFANNNDKPNGIPYKDQNSSVPIVNRINWLAQPALGEKEYLPEPAKYVIICHSATEEAFTQADNTLIVRLIQTFHIESRQWQDIAYNFLIGSDGLAYEGRGWGVVGSHTRGYNYKSLGIAFIGCFLSHLPPKKSLKKAQDLIELGVKRGSIAKDYVLLAHCQCSSIESPGKRLFEEIKTWKNWDSSITPPSTIFPTIVHKSAEEDGYAENLP